MGRKRTKDKHLPWRMYVHGKSYRFIPPKGEPVGLGTDYTEALHLYAEVVAAYRSGTGGLRTMADIFDRYQAEVLPTKAKTTQDTNTYELKKLRAVFGHMTPAAVRPAHIYGYMDRRKGPDGKPARTRANREIALLSGVLGCAIRWGVLEANPCRDVKRHKETPGKRYVTAEEFWAVYDLASDKLKLLMLLVASCGFRGSELRRLKWDQVCDEGILFQHGKGGKKQLLKRNATMTEALEMAKSLQRRGSVPVITAYVFCRDDGKPYANKNGIGSMWTRLQNAYAALGGEKFTMKDLRAKSGSDHETGDHLGHKDKRTLNKHYRRRPEEVDVVEIERIG